MTNVSLMKKTVYSYAKQTALENTTQETHLIINA